MTNRPLKIFFSGIGGSGVSAIASFMADKGHKISGSDRAFDQNSDHPVYKTLKLRGINIVPQNGSGIDNSFDFVVFSTAVEHDQPEYLKARDLNIPIKTRPEYLSEIVSDFKTIAVAGTSGKSTTAGMLAFLMQRLGLNPNFIGGGRVKQFRTETNPGNSITGISESLVIEACESDGTIADYRPEHAIISNLELDHHFIDKTSEMFKSLAKNTSGKIIINADDGNLLKIGIKNPITFSIDKPSKYMASDITFRSLSSDFSLNGVRFGLSLPGKYNLYNAISCIAVLSETGVPLKDIAGIVYEFEGVERRFDIHLNTANHLVIDDYAHNPHKISSLMQTVQSLKDSICYIFQPHGFGPTRMMKKEYIEAFSQNLRDSDHLILLPIYYAGGTASRDIASADIAEGVQTNKKSVEVVDSRDTVTRRSNEWDNYVVFGARDETLSSFTKRIADSLN